VVELQLPWPPSINRYWRCVQGATLLSREGREYKHKAKDALFEQLYKLKHTAIDVPCKATIIAHYPNKRRRDLDNIIKPVLDCLQASEVVRNDELFKELHVIGVPVTQIDPEHRAELRGTVHVFIEELP
jgi:crossover junction endodeoxyribonuclease RusA